MSVFLLLVFNGACAVLVSTLATAQWQTMAVNASSPVSTALYWQATASILSYTNTTDGKGRACMRLLANSSIYESDMTAAWASTSPIPPFNAALCSARRITLTSNFAYTDDMYTPQNMYNTGLMARMGLSDDASASLSISGMAAGVLGGIAMSMFNTANINFVHPNAVVGQLSLRYVCTGNVTPLTCYFSERTDLPYQRVNAYNSTFVAVITGTTMRAVSYSVYDITNSRALFNLNLTAFPYSISAKNWLNSNGTMPAPMVLLTSITTNVTVYQLDVDITDTCMPAPPPTPMTTRVFTIGTPVPPVPNPTTLASTTTTTTTMSAPNTDTPMTEPPSTGTTLASATSEQSSTTNGVLEASTTRAPTFSMPTTMSSTATGNVSTLVTAPIDTPPGAVMSPIGPQSYSALFAVGAIVVLFIIFVVILCLCRQRIKASHRYATFYNLIPRNLRCCCAPKRSRTDDDHEVGEMQFGTVPAYLKDGNTVVNGAGSANAGGKADGVQQSSSAVRASASSADTIYSSVRPRDPDGYSPIPAPPATRQFTQEERKAKRDKRKKEGKHDPNRERPITQEDDRFDDVPIHPVGGARKQEIIYDRVMTAAPLPPPLQLSSEISDVSTSSDSPKKPVARAAKSQYDAVHSKLEF